ncbi:glycolate oxidase iron-sulfur subunit [Desulfofundulus luciae]|uniref:Glycolate oxidase iron-sulfur subunit n=1 Tax=Desulfofundulus luciae TaxID=74702 RepID=A0ABU0B2I7_9FIRM|nr:(Fe-S)-binding protein [Desulfofundulus luciae]MDQ0286934.1 glycolate oxidase iron-sulfur subunit [Desulfofundulus luciae]
MNDDAGAAKYQINRCSKCGSCREVCPVFSEMGGEPWVARARVQLANAAIEGQIDFSRRFREIMESCLLCKACVTHCPNGVRVDKLVLWARQEAVRKQGLPFIKKSILRNVLRYNHRLELLARVLAAYRATGLRLTRKEGLLPPVRVAPFRRLARIKKLGKPSLLVAYFTGCMTQYVYHQTGSALLDVLTENNVQVVLPEQYCCGMPALAAGDSQTVRELARGNVESIMKTGVDYIVTDCPTCGEMLKSYGELLGEDAAGDFSSKVQDISYFLAHTVGFREPAGKLPLVVTYHDPCHLKRGQGIWSEPRKILAAIPGLSLKEMAESDWCCGSAGSFGLTYYELSMKILRRKVENIRATGAQAVVTGCPSCRLQIEYGLNQAGIFIPVLHTLELLSRVYGPANASLSLPSVCQRQELVAPTANN